MTSGPATPPQASPPKWEAREALAVLGVLLAFLLAFLVLPAAVDLRPDFTGLKVFANAETKWHGWYIVTGGGAPPNQAVLEGQGDREIPVNCSSGRSLEGSIASSESVDNLTVGIWVRGQKRAATFDSTVAIDASC